MAPVARPLFVGGGRATGAKPYLVRGTRAIVACNYIINFINFFITLFL